MSERRQTLIVSDLHLGGGAADPGDDHVYQNRQLERFVRQSLASPAGQEGQIELFFNGDFLEFAQVRQEAYRSPSTDYWCSEPESLEKLEAILAGHDNSFAALQAFQEAGNRVTLAAGNHDVDLCWPAVRKRLRARIGPGLRFETGVDWVERHDGRLHIGHGHLEDPANRFKHWSAPILQAPDGARLEMCPGTLFMVRFVNGLEARYPFADNLHPVQNLATVLLREDTGGFASAGWMLLKFIARHAKTLGASEASDVGRRLLARLREDDDFAQRLAAACRLLGAERSPESVRRDVSDEDSAPEPVIPEQIQSGRGTGVADERKIPAQVDGQFDNAASRGQRLLVADQHIRRQPLADADDLPGGRIAGTKAGVLAMLLVCRWPDPSSLPLLMPNSSIPRPRCTAFSGPAILAAEKRFARRPARHRPVLPRC
jgi:UDP-2,3-diacylglucosamine pyrophosphatase LpxH